MSTIDPDARGRAISAVLRPFARVAAIAALATGPLFFVIMRVTGSEDAGFILVYVFATVAAGLLALYTSRRRPGMLVAAYSVAYMGGLFLVIAGGASESDPNILVAIITVGVPYAVVVLLCVLYFLREAAVRQTTTTGVDTTAEVMSVGVDGMINYVQHQRMTLKFVDQQGTTRYFRIGRTGGGVSKGDTFHIRYDPARPWSKRSIIVDF